MKKIPAKKKAILVFAIAAFAAAVYNLLWFANYRAYDKYIGNGYEVSSASSTNYSRQSDEATFHVKKPGYLGFVGNLAVANEDQSVILLIWPSFMCDSINDYGLMLYDNEQDRGFMVNVNSEMAYDAENRTGLSPNDEAAARKLLETLHDAVLEQLSRA
ncbi:MAG: hypothetical protein LBD92_04080, partial [Oscillospiraceae bacterium]|nr:hypothetical protein [Oscillospiraceae bacterium]